MIAGPNFDATGPVDGKFYAHVVKSKQVKLGHCDSPDTWPSVAIKWKTVSICQTSAIYRVTPICTVKLDDRGHFISIYCNASLPHAPLPLNSTLSSPWCTHYLSTRTLTVWAASAHHFSKHMLHLVI